MKPSYLNVNYYQKNLNTWVNEVVTRDKGGHPSSYKFDDEWDFTHSHASRKKVSFKNINDKSIMRLIQHSLWLIHNYRDFTLSPSSLDTMKSRIKSIIVLTELSDWHYFDDDNNYRQFKALVKERYSEAYAKTLFTILSQLYLVGLLDRVIESPESIAKKSVRRSKQSICIPERYAAQLYQLAWDVVDRYYPYRHEISDVFSDFHSARDKWISEGRTPTKFTASSLAAKFSAFELSSGEVIHVNCNGTIVSKISIACKILSCGFTGARDSEVNTFEANSFEVIEDSGIEFGLVHGKTSKTRGGKPERASWVTHPELKRVLDLAYDSTAYSRIRLKEIFKSDTLNLIRSESPFILTSTLISATALSAKSITSQLEEWAINNGLTLTDEDIGEFNLLNPDRVGECSEGGWLKMHKHGFRRTFAVFMVRNRLGSIWALKRQYKHLNSVMTRWYTNGSNIAEAYDISLSEELLREINKVNIEAATDTYFRIINAPTLSGLQGEKLDHDRKEKGFDVSKNTVFMDRNEVHNYIKARNISYVEHPTGYCFNPTCSRICSGDLSTLTCSFEVTTTEKAMARLPVRDDYIRQYNERNTGEYSQVGLLNFLKLKIEAIEITLINHNIPHTTFNGSLKVPRVVVSKAEMAYD